MEMTPSIASDKLELRPVLGSNGQVHYSDQAEGEAIFPTKTVLATEVAGPGVCAVCEWKGQPALVQESLASAPIALEPLGDRAFLAYFATESAAAGWAGAVRDWQWPGVIDVVAAYRTAAVFADPDLVDLVELESRLCAVVPAEAPHIDRRHLVIPVLYDGVDLGDVAAKLALSTAEVIEQHCQVEYDVFAIGFLPGFPYAGYLPPGLAGLARRESPRMRVPAGSVAIAGRQTAIYPSESPGGWHLLGSTPLQIVDLAASYFPINAGDRIRFEPISVSEFEARRHERL
jgi:KipI family sensor histidine kinase inhibitor